MVERSEEESAKRSFLCVGLNIFLRKASLRHISQNSIWSFFPHGLTSAGKATNKLSTLIWLKISERSEASKIKI
jgi:hypothetical protein